MTEIEQLCAEVKERLAWWGGDPFSLDRAAADAEWIRGAARRLVEYIEAAEDEAPAYRVPSEREMRGLPG